MGVQSRARVDVRALAHSREIAVCQDGGLFPILTTALDGSICAVVRGGAGHFGRDGRLDVMRSRDGGLSWSPPAIIADSNDDDRNAAVGTTPGGAIVVAYMRCSSYDSEGIYYGRPRAEDATYWTLCVTRSTDNGLTWQAPFEPAPGILSVRSPYGKIVAMQDGALLMPCTGMPLADMAGARPDQLRDDDYYACLLRSRDDGLTWGDPSLICVNAYEPALLPLGDGRLLAVVRREHMGKSLWSLHSSDGGYTWSEPRQVTGYLQHPGDLLALSNGYLLLAYGNRNTPPARVEGLVSRDGGRSWLDVILTFSGQLCGYDSAFAGYVDLGYPSSVIVPGRKPAVGVTMYYHNPSITDGGRNVLHNASFYTCRNDRAVAVAWREDELIAAVDASVP